MSIRQWSLFRNAVAIGILSFCGCSNPTKENKSEVVLQVLGIAQDAGVPQIGCTKSCCALKQSPQRKLRVTSLGLSDTKNEMHWIFDATPDFPSQYNQCVPPNENVSGIFLTHAHIGHYTGLMYLGREAMNAENVAVWTMPRMKDFLKLNGPWSQLIQLENVALKDLHADSIIKLNNQIKVKPILVPHRDEFSETVGYIIYGPKKSALFIPDVDKWERWENSIVQLVKHVDYAFLDATFYDNAELPGRDMSEIPHPFVVETMKAFEEESLEVRNKVYLIHLNHTNPLLDSKSDAYQNTIDFGFNIANSGAKFSL